MGKRILLVEDDKTTLHILAKYINDLGYDLIQSVATGEEAIEAVHDTQPDIILMNIYLSGKLDGIAATERIKELHNIPIIFITSTSDNVIIQRAMATNPSGYVIKPVDKRELNAVLEIALIRKEMEEKLQENELQFFTILNSIGDAVIVLDKEEKISYMNPIAERMTEWNIVQIIGKKLDEIIEFGNNYCLKDRRDYIMDRPNYIFMKSRTGREIPVDFSASMIQDIDGAVTATVIVLRDDSDRVNSEIRLKESYNQIKRAMGGVIQAMAQTLETRDPYTAGHQRRVADIARTIAEEMNLEEDQIEGIHLAGIIHDLGKISIPTEILSKPGLLSEIEFDLIRTHPQTGYDILRKIDFPWPLAQIVYQHHERLNGTGYPRGIEGEDILIEARIISVADVVEAMASSRPYRVALGIDNALQEISTNSGVLYDDDVVEACLTLFRVQQYQMI
jgi:PAS domain S-box-containing protein/putative nucleotidyltransferase with HDIG domain